MAILFLIYILPVIVLIGVARFLLKGRKESKEKIASAESILETKISPSFLLLTSASIMVAFMPVISYGFLGFAIIFGIGTVVTFSGVMLIAWIGSLLNRGYTRKKFYTAIVVASATGLLFGGILMFIYVGFMAFSSNPIPSQPFMSGFIITVVYWPFVALTIAKVAFLLKKSIEG